MTEKTPRYDEGGAAERPAPRKSFVLRMSPELHAELRRWAEARRPVVSLETTFVLVAVTLASTMLSGAVGMGGGTLLVAAMANLLPPGAVVPVHGVVQLCSNSSRGLLLLRHVVWSLFLLYIPLQLIGVAVATQLYRGEQLTWFRPAIGFFVLAWLAWDRWRPKHLEVGRGVFALAGFGGGVLTILVGVTGPYLAAFFLRRDLEKEQVVATKAAIQTVGHLAKIPAFLSLGFDYTGQLPAIAPLVVAALLGTWLGTRWLRSATPRAFGLGFRVVLGLLALKLIAPVFV